VTFVHLPIFAKKKETRETIFFCVAQIGCSPSPTARCVLAGAKPDGLLRLTADDGHLVEALRQINSATPQNRVVRDSPLFRMA
jgi:hypothetical protein